MPSLKVVVKKLNKRKLIPASLPDPNNIIGEVVDGHNFQGDEVTQVPNINLGKWYVDRDGYYYWGGGLQINNEEEVPIAPVHFEKSTFEQQGINWRDNFIGLSPDLKANGGRNVKVAIIDTGVDISHPALLSSIETPMDFTQNSQQMTDDVGHGTAIAGIIAARFTHSKSLLGVAPECTIVPIKVMRNIYDRDSLKKYIVQAISYAIECEVDIINISMKFPMDVQVLVKEVIKDAAGESIVLIASAGDLDRLTEIGVTYPGSDDNFISIGSTNKEYLKTILDNRPQNLDFLGGNKFLQTLSSNQKEYTLKKGSSFCAAFMSAASALYISTLKSKGLTINQFPKKQVKDFLSGLVTDQKDLLKENYFSFIKI